MQRSNAALVRIVAGLAAVAALLVGAPAASAANCTVTGTTLTYTLAGESAVLRVAGNRISIPGANCPGAPGPSDVSSIVVTGGTGAESLSITDAATFAPGSVAEVGSTSEIEVSVDLGGGADELLLTGSSATDTYVAGTAGLDYNNDDDADITFANVELLGLFGSGGNDTLSAGGDASTGGQASIRLTLEGGLGNDVLTGGTRSDTFLQEPGSDAMRGGAGIDTVSYVAATTPVVVTVGIGRTRNDGTAGEADAVGSDIEIVRGGSASDRLTGNGGRSQLFGNSGSDRLMGGGGIDTLKGGAGNDFIVGGPAADVLFGDGGADTFFSRDSLRDRLYGGTGIDRSRADAIDFRASVERRF